jgi:8-oxo-dGTP pyrophosphatase MutT (NUDIX family)
MVPAAASTVVVMRERTDASLGGGFDVYLLRRAPGAAFLAEACVFPGGRVDAAPDAALAESLSHAMARLPVPSPTRPAEYALHLAAALRELFEEAGLLLADTADGTDIALDAGTLPLAALRHAVASGHTPLDQACTSLGGRLRPERLVPQSRWITPPGEARRFDTWVFLAQAPAGQTPSPDGGETSAGRWLPPGEALARAEAGEIALAPPTSRTLEDLLPFRSVAEALEAARRVAPATYAPMPVRTPDGDCMVLPGDPLYPGEGPGAPLGVPVRGATRFQRIGGRWRSVDAVTITPRISTTSSP